MKDCSSTIVLQFSRPELHHREQHRNRRPEDQRKNRRAAREQQKSNSRTAVKKQRDSSSFNFVLRCARQHRRHRCTWLVTPNVQMIRIIASDPQRASSSSSSSISSSSSSSSSSSTGIVGSGIAIESSKSRRRTEEQQESSSRATAGQQSRGNETRAGRCVHLGLLVFLQHDIPVTCNK